MSPYIHLIQSYFQDYLRDLQELVSIESVSDEQTSCPPFGEGVKLCFETFSTIAKRMGFEVEEDDGYAVSANVNVNSSPIYIGILGHLDVVEAGNLNKWKYPPFQLTEDSGILYGRGVNDDKGPLLAQLYCIKILQDLGYSFKYNIKVIAGGAEETTWHCMDHYFQNHSQPIMGYSPDGNFPIVNGEKGILTLEIETPLMGDGCVFVDSICSMPKGFAIADYIELHCSCDDQESLPDHLCQFFNHGKAVFIFQGKSALTRNPHKADNATFKMVDFVLENAPYFDTGLIRACSEIKQYFTDPFGKGCGYYHVDPDMGESTLAVFDFQIGEKSCSYKLDFRFGKQHTAEEINISIKEITRASVREVRFKRPLFIPQNDPLIQKLSEAYRNICHEEPKCFSKGGASYARVLDRGIAFGATFDGYDTRPHDYNENMRVEDLVKAMEIYCESIRLLACE